MKKIKVLVVDNAYFMRELIIKELNKYGCNVVGEAKDGEEAIEKFKNLKPDLVTIDIKLPKLDGISTIKEIIKIDSSANIIVITGDYDFEKKALEVGATDFLKKPFQPAFLWRKIDKLIEEKKIILNSNENDLLYINEYKNSKKKLNNCLNNEFVIENNEFVKEEFVIEDSKVIDKNNNGFISENDNKFTNNDFIINNSELNKDNSKPVKEENIEEVVAISIRPPRFKNNFYETKKHYIDDNTFIEPPIINYKEEETNEKSTIFEKISDKIKKFFK